MEILRSVKGIGVWSGFFYGFSPIAVRTLPVYGS